MRKANIKYRISTSDTLRALPIGEEQVLPGALFSIGEVRKKASALKSTDGLIFKVSQTLGMKDIYVTRIS